MGVTVFMSFWAVLALGPLRILAICETSSGKHISYRNQGLISVPKQIPSDVSVLDLSINNIRVLPNYTMETLHGLRSLSLSSNRIHTIEPFAFHGLEELCFLDLYDNSIVHIGNDTLGSLSNTKLKKIVLTKCEIVSIETGAFLNFGHLEVLDLSGNKGLGLNKALHSLYGLQDIYHQNMTDIIITKVNSHSTRFEERVVNGTSAKYLKNICVGNLELGKNDINFIGVTFLTSLRYPECLRRFSLAGRQMLEIKEYRRFFFELLTRFKYLEYLDLSVKDSHSQRHKRGLGKVRKSTIHEHIGLHVSSDRSKTTNSDLGLQVYFPPFLKVLNVSGGIFRSTTLNLNVRFKNAGNLRVLDLSFNGLSHCTGHWSGLENLTVLNMTGIDWSQLSANFLSSFPGLEVLEVQDVLLNQGLQSDDNGVFFHPQDRLTRLNMADNGLTNLHPALFSSLTLVKVLSLGNNKLSTIPQTVRSMSSLGSLDMSYNTITNLGHEDREWLEEISLRNRHFRLSLYGNPLSCTCSTLDFVLWIMDTKIELEMKDELTCTLENGTRTPILKLKANLKDMRVACISRFWLTFSLTVASVTVAVLCISVICYRHRHNIKYRFLTYWRCRHPYAEVPIDDCQYDAFVAYNHEDYRWACHTLREFLEDVHGYRLCLHHRDFPVGESIQGNIVDSINASRKIILVISQKYLACDWGEFEIQMASMRMVQSGRDNVVIAILLEDIPVRKMPKTLLKMWKEITFLLWTNDPGEENICWGRLREAMGRI